LVEYVDAICPGGKVVVISNSIEPKVHFCTNRAVLQNITIIGNISCIRVEFKEIIDLIANGMIKSEKYVIDILTFMIYKKLWKDKLIQMIH